MASPQDYSGTSLRYLRPLSLTPGVKRPNRILRLFTRDEQVVAVPKFNRERYRVFKRRKGERVLTSDLFVRLLSSTLALRGVGQRARELPEDSLGDFYGAGSSTGRG